MTHIIRWFTVLTIVFAVSTAWAKRGSSDINVKVVFQSGKTLNYSSQVRTVELLLAPNGAIQTIHLVLAMKGTAKDTHEWYNFSNLAGFSYTYLAVTGRAKVKVKRIEPIGLTESPKGKVPPIKLDEYR